MFVEKIKNCKLILALLSLLLFLVVFYPKPASAQVNYALTGTPSHANQLNGPNTYLVWTWQDELLNDNSTAAVAHGVYITDNEQSATWASFDSIITWGTPIAQLNSIEVVAGRWGNQFYRLRVYIDTGAGWQQVADSGDMKPALVGANTYTYNTGAPWYNVQRIKVNSYTQCASFSHADYRLFELRAFGPSAPSYQDIGLRVKTPSGVVSIAAEIGAPTSPLRIAKGGVVYGIVLVDPGDPYDSGVRIKVSGALKALRKL